MKRAQLLLFLLIVLAFVPGVAHAQAWSGILDPTRAIDWSAAGVPGGIPSGTWTQSGSTILASTFGNGASDATSGIQTALNACGTNHFVLLGAGTFRINTFLSIPNNCVLRGAGASQTKLNDMGTSSGLIRFGTNGLTGVNPPFSGGNSTTFTGGAQGASTITVASATGITVGSLLMLSQPNLSYMTEFGHGGDCNFCTSGQTNDFLSGQIVRVTNVAGTVLTIAEPLYIGYANPSYVFRFTATVATNSGLENLKLSQNNTHSNANSATIQMIGAYASWVKGVESDFADNAHMFLQYSLHCEVRDSFFHDAFRHGPGSNDQQLNLAYKASANLIINNIFWRMHAGVMVERGPAGNVIAYNYLDGNYNTSPTNVQEPGLDSHGAHPMMNLYEGNIVNFMLWDDFWGSSSHHTLFRNYVIGTTQNVPPRDVRGALQPGSFVWEDGNFNGFGIDINDLNDFYNVVGVIIGSPHATAQGYLDSLVSPTNARGSGNCISLNCVGIRYGYDGANDAIINPNTVFPTTFVHGVYGTQSGTFTWDAGHPNHTLPASFFLSAKPSWWGAQAWPPIGPDVTGGNIAGVGGFANRIPALDCFNATTVNGTVNTGVFDPTTCYAASSPAFPAVVLSPSNVSFGNVIVGVTTSPQVITLTNSGSATLAITGIVRTGATDFAISANTCGGTLAAGGNCSVSVTFAPSSSGVKNGALVFTTNASSSPDSAPLSGTGIPAFVVRRSPTSLTSGRPGVTPPGPAVTFSPTSLTFGNSIIGVTTTSQAVTLTNTGTAPLTITSIALTGTNAANYAISGNTCGGSLGTGLNCTVNVTFTPSAAGVRTAALTFTTNASTSPDNVPLSGTGVATFTVNLTPASLAFGSSAVGNVVGAQTITLLNAGSAAIAISSIALTGANPGDFVIFTNTCGSTLAAGGNCVVNVTFTPTALGARSASLAVTSNALSSPNNTTLSGTGVTPPAPSVSLNPISMMFGSIGLGNGSAPQVVTLTNSGTASLGITSITLTGANPGDYSIVISTCGTSLSPGLNCTVSVTFVPTAVGTRSANLTFTTNSAGSPDNVGLTGTGLLILAEKSRRHGRKLLMP